MATRCRGVISFASIGVHVGRCPGTTQRSQAALTASKSRMSANTIVAVSNRDLSVPHSESVSSICARICSACSPAVGAGSRATLPARYAVLPWMTALLYRVPEPTYLMSILESPFDNPLLLLQPGPHRLAGSRLPDERRLGGFAPGDLVQFCRNRFAGFDDDRRQLPDPRARHPRKRTGNSDGANDLIARIAHG